ncbi:MAG: DUF1415 domain-containing protein [Cycloclasticus sp.]|nr:DUF1415 domain-containing protein [Cycloclasticus sp.]MBQ0790041.1 DUF1415 domain-containing protein [Cycloclasticus sp.]
MVSATNNAIIASCQHWVKTVIVGLNFCPFAKPVLDAGKVYYTVVNKSAFEACLMALSDELTALSEQPHRETSLLIYPMGFEAFEDYLDLLSVAQALLEDQGYEGVFQLASFHPGYCFEGQASDDAANYTNRSPYPMLHILREASVEKALSMVAHPDKIPTRNIDFARAKGQLEMQRLLTACRIIED